jgi:predicted metal-dependent hydrolase
MRLVKMLRDLHRRDRQHGLPPEVAQRIARLRKLLNAVEAHWEDWEMGQKILATQEISYLGDCLYDDLLESSVT